MQSLRRRFHHHRDFGGSEENDAADRVVLFSRRIAAPGLGLGIDVFADFSNYQAMGLTAMEAMCCGAAVIVPQILARTPPVYRRHLDCIEARTSAPAFAQNRDRRF